MSKKLLRVFSVLLIVSACLISVASVGMSQSMLDIREFMTPQELEDTGLADLSSQEINALNRWFTVYSISLVELVQSQITEEASTASQVIETRIKGAFNGWDGKTVFELQNGQIWQQDSYGYTYHYAYSPEVTIYPEGARFKMKVEGVSSEIYVKRIK